MPIEIPLGGAGIASLVIMVYVIVAVFCVRAMAIQWLSELHQSGKR